MGSIKKDKLFYIIFVLTILVIRLGVFLFPQRKITIGGVGIYHFWIGVILMLVFLLITRRYSLLRMGVFSVGLGIITDELTFMLTGAGTLVNYWSAYSIVGVILLAAIVFVFRKSLVRKI